MLEVGVVEGTAFAVLEPLFTDLVAADAEGPDVRRDVAEILGGVDVDATGGFGGGERNQFIGCSCGTPCGMGVSPMNHGQDARATDDPVNFVGASLGEVGDEVVELGGLQEVEGILDLRLVICDWMTER